jgi:hypothetical protein
MAFWLVTAGVVLSLVAAGWLAGRMVLSYLMLRSLVEFICRAGSVSDAGAVEAALARGYVRGAARARPAQDS